MGEPWASKLEPSWPFWPLKTSGLAHFYLLKLNVFKRWRLGGLRARFWRSRASILEGLGSIFPRFSAKTTINVKNLPRKDIDHRFAGPPRVGVRRWSPMGDFNPPPTEGVRSVLDTQPHRFQIRPDQSQRANLKGQALYARPGSCSPLFFSPQEAGDHRSPPLNLRVLRLVGPLGSFFCSSDTLFKNDIEKTSKKMRKSRILASQNPPKIRRTAFGAQACQGNVLYLQL